MMKIRCYTDSNPYFTITVDIFGEALNLDMQDIAKFIATKSGLGSNYSPDNIKVLLPFYLAEIAAKAVRE